MTIKQLSGIIISFVLAMALVIIPLPGWAIWLRLPWVALVFICWALILPHGIGVTTAWLLGVVVDILHNTLLGEHALALGVVAYALLRWRGRFVIFTFWQQLLSAWGLLLVYQAILLWVQGLIGQMPSNNLYWLSIFVGMLVWPWVFSLLKSYSNKLNIY